MNELEISDSTFEQLCKIRWKQHTHNIYRSDHFSEILQYDETASNKCIWVIPPYSEDASFIFCNLTPLQNTTLLNILKEKK